VNEPSAGPDELGRASERVATRWIGRAHEHHAELGSTNDRAWAWLREGAPHGALVTADRQTSGRGRRGRPWVAEAELGLTMSLVLLPEAVPPAFGALSLAIAVGLRRALAQVVGLTVKWPNDLLVGGRKLAGILCECRWAGPRPQVVVGIGINVGQQTFGHGLDGQATSLALEGVVRTRTDVLVAVLACLEPAIDTFVAHGFGPLCDEYESYCPWLGGTIFLSSDAGEGRRRVFAKALRRDGTLIVEDAGVLRPIEAGEIWLP